MDGVEYAIDLSNANAAKLRDSLAPFVGSGQRQGGRKHRGADNVGGSARKTSSKERNQAIREWARGQGEKISDRSRIMPSSSSAFRLVMQFDVGPEAQEPGPPGFWVTCC